MAGNNNISERLAQIRLRMALACQAAKRAPESVTLVTVSKTQSAAAVMEALAAGQRDFGENYVQEALTKQVQVGRESAIWHFIGPIQSNKTRDLAENFDWVHGLDRLKIAQRLSQQRPESLPPLNVCVQVNISGEASKSGMAPAEVAELCRQLVDLPRLRLRGLMAIPAPVAGAADSRTPFRRMRELHGALQALGLPLDTLSMGMSDDFEAAIAEGATLVRIGSAIFGARGP